MENSRNKEFLSFKLDASLSSVMKSQAVPLSPAQDVNQPCDPGIHTVYATYPLVIR